MARAGGVQRPPSSSSLAIRYICLFLRIFNTILHVNVNRSANRGFLSSWYSLARCVLHRALSRLYFMLNIYGPNGVWGLVKNICSLRSILVWCDTQSFIVGCGHLAGVHIFVNAYIQFNCVTFNSNLEYGFGRYVGDAKVSVSFGIFVANRFGGEQSPYFC